MRSRESFNKVAELYDEVRPTYPDNVIDWIVERSNIKTEKQLLEIAPGTGQATKKFVERGFSVHAVELGENLAELLQENMKDRNVTVDISPFEDWDAKGSTYQMIYCATAWHWIDPSIGYQKAYDLLDENGKLVLLWNNSIGSADNIVLNQAYDVLFKYNSDREIHTTKPKSKEQVSSQKLGTKEEVEASGLFLLDDYYIYEWSFKQPKEKMIKGFYTQSSFVSLPFDIQEKVKIELKPIFEQLDDYIDTHFRTAAYICKKK